MSVPRIANIEKRTEDNTQRIGQLEREETRTRERLHRLEGDRKAIALLMELTKSLAEQTKTLAEQAARSVASAEAIAENAALKAVEQTFDKRRAFMARSVMWTALVLGGFGGFGYLIAYLIHG